MDENDHFNTNYSGNIQTPPPPGAFYAPCEVRFTHLSLTRPTETCFIVDINSTFMCRNATI